MATLYRLNAALCKDITAEAVSDTQEVRTKVGLSHGVQVRQVFRRRWKWEGEALPGREEFPDALSRLVVGHTFFRQTCECKSKCCLKLKLITLKLYISIVCCINV